jgi:hypothetical protein
MWMAGSICGGFDGMLRDRFRDAAEMRATLHSARVVSLLIQTRPGQAGGASSSSAMSIRVLPSVRTPVPPLTFTTM